MLHSSVMWNTSKPPNGGTLARDAGAVRVAPGEDRGPRRTAQRVGDDVAVEARALALHLLDVAHVRQQVARQVVGQHEHDVRLARPRCGARSARARMVSSASRMSDIQHRRPEVASLRVMSATAVNERLAALTAAGHEHLARPAGARADRLRRAGADGRAGVAARRHVEPGDLREVDPRLGRLRRRPQAAGRRGQERARDLPRDGAARRARGVRRAAAGLRRDERRRRLRVVGGRAAARARHRGDARAGPHVLGAGRPPEPDDQDPGHRGRAARDRAGAVRRA